MSLRTHAQPKEKQTLAPIFFFAACLFLNGEHFSQGQATVPSQKEAMNANQNSLAVHNSAIIIDTHADTPQRFVDEHWNFTDSLNGGMLNYEDAKRGNLGGQFF